MGFQTPPELEREPLRRRCGGSCPVARHDNIRLGLERQTRAQAVDLRHEMQERLARTDRLRNHKYRNYEPGKLVCVWRLGKTNDERGRWFGPREVLETCRNIVGDERHSGNQVYVIMNCKMLSCNQRARGGEEDEDQYEEQCRGGSSKTSRRISTIN